VRCPRPPGGSARIIYAPQPGQVGRLAWPMEVFCRRPELSSIQENERGRRHMATTSTIPGGQDPSHCSVSSMAAARTIYSRRVRPNALANGAFNVREAKDRQWFWMRRQAQAAYPAACLPVDLPPARPLSRSSSARSIPGAEAAPYCQATRCAQYSTSSRPAFCLRSWVGP